MSLTCSHTLMYSNCLPQVAPRSRTVGIAHSWTALTAVCVSVWLVMRCLYFVGFEGSDDMFYMRFAALWHRTPANQWEVRLLANALIGLFIRVFGYHEWAAALPSMLGSLAVLATALLGCRVFVSIRHAWWAGLLIAVLPLDVSSATNISAHTLMVGLMAAGTIAFVHAPASRPAAWIAAVCLPLGVVTHWNGGYYLLVALVAALLVDWRKYLKPALLVCTGGTLFMAADILVFHLLYGDAFCRFRICMPHNLEAETGVTEHMNFQTVTWSLQNLIAGKPFGIALFVTLCGSAIRYRCLHRPLRVLFWITSLYWLQISFGSLVPWDYQPFWRNARYLHLLVLPVAVLFATLMVEARHRSLLQPVGVVSILACLTILNAGGSWGRSVQISRELLAYVQTHPHQQFVADVHTMNEIYVLNGLKTPPNLFGTSDAVKAHFIDADVRRMLTPEVGTCDAILINPLNVERRPSFDALIRSHLGPIQHETPCQLRPICRLLPSLATSSWAVRKPAARVHAAVPAQAGTLTANVRRSGL